MALRAEIDSWRWAGLPFYVRTGKRLATTATEVLVEFKQPPRLFFARSETGMLIAGDGGWHCPELSTDR